MRVMPKPLSSEELRLIVDTVVHESKTGYAHKTEKYPPVTPLDSIKAFQEDFLKVRLPGAIKMVCK